MPGPAFPEDFLIGSATAAHQVEGGNVASDFWLLEHLAESPFAEPSGDACDHYHRYREDIALMASLGLQAYRFSVEWARIEPEPGVFSLAALDHYRRMVACCREHDLLPVVTLYHFTSPIWLAARGGWEDPESPALFTRYAERVSAHLGDLWGAACTLNEPDLGKMLQHDGVLPPTEVLTSRPFLEQAAKRCGSDRFRSFVFGDLDRMQEHLLQAHRTSAEALRAGPGDAPVGVTLAISEDQSIPGGEPHEAAKHADAFAPWLELARGDDFVGVQTYTRTVFGPDGPLPPKPGVETTQMGYEFRPQSLEATVRSTAEATGVPIWVTENGIATADDTRRIAFFEEALAGVARTLADGVDVRAYFYWSTLDNFEWLLGYRPQFGLIGVDRASQARTAKPSARRLGEIARTRKL